MVKSWYKVFKWCTNRNFGQMDKSGHCKAGNETQIFSPASRCRAAACWQMGSWLGEGLAGLDKKFCAGWQQVDHTQPCIDVTPDKGELFASNQRHHGWGKVGQCMFPPDDKWLNLPDKCWLAEQCSYRSSQCSEIQSNPLWVIAKNCTQRCATPPSTQKSTLMTKSAESALTSYASCV